jgi:hypothetical protein
MAPLLFRLVEEEGTHSCKIRYPRFLSIVSVRLVDNALLKELRERKVNRDCYKMRAGWIYLRDLARDLRAYVEQGGRLRLL